MKLNQFLSPFRIIIVAYFILILISSFLLYLPFSQRDGVELTFFEAFFTASSATESMKAVRKRESPREEGIRKSSVLRYNLSPLPHFLLRRII